uniref:Uncharacterized protein n=1 Tax=Avena sativa TaxID=4498 RepID=A0ACD6AB14_AVESA
MTRTLICYGLQFAAMEYWLYYYLLSATVCLALYLFLSSLRPPATGGPRPQLPPGPSALTVAGLLFFYGRGKFGTIIRLVRSWYGPVFTLPLKPSHPTIFVSDHAATHRALVQCGAALADRPPATFSSRIFSSDQHDIASCSYGPLWSVLRRNLTGRVLHPSNLQRYAGARRRAADVLVAGITRQTRDDSVVVIEELLHRAVYHVLVCMCFGEGLDSDDVVSSIEAVQREFTTSAIGFQVLDVYTAVAKIVFRRTWKKLVSLRRRQEELLVPLIRARGEGGGAINAVSYVDSLLGLSIPEDGSVRNLTEGEMVSLCSEFLAAGTDSTAAVAQWVMANLVEQPEIQAKLRAEIRDVSGDGVFDEQNLSRMPYLKAVVLEGLRRHPPAQFVMPHAATMDGYDGTPDAGFHVPRHASVNFALAEMGLDEVVWPEAKRFRPERFLPGGEGADLHLTGGKGEIKMIPFGAGRRACPGIELSLLHLEYLVARLVSGFEWHAAVDGEQVDFAERLELSIVMRRPLRARVIPCS